MSAHDAHAADHGDGHPSFLAHHFETPAQQFESGKLGMWLFLATEVLLFGGLFCAYAVMRFNHPEIFAYGSQFLDTKWGAINTVVLILSSLTMAAAVTAAQQGRRRALVTLLTLTFLGGAGFMCIKYVEYAHKLHLNYVWGTGLYEVPDDHGEHAPAAVPAQARVADAEQGRSLYLGTCRACHGVSGEGIPGEGKAHRGNAFIAETSDDELVAFINAGRQPTDPLNTTGRQMPPKGGNALLTDDDLHDIVAYMRTFEAGGAIDVADASTVLIPRSAVAPAAAGPPGLRPSGDAHADDAHADGEAATSHGEPDPRTDPSRPANLHIFFGIYFAMTGLHGVHVLAGMAIILWLIIRSARGHFGVAYFTPVDLGGLYWHIVDMIWIFLFPLLYLIA